jgi:hypothetical protein
MWPLKEAWWREFHTYNPRARRSVPLYGRIVG